MRFFPYPGPRIWFFFYTQACRCEIFSISRPVDIRFSPYPGLRIWVFFHIQACGYEIFSISRPADMRCFLYPGLRIWYLFSISRPANMRSFRPADMRMCPYPGLWIWDFLNIQACGYEISSISKPADMRCFLYPGLQIWLCSCGCGCFLWLWLCLWLCGCGCGCGCPGALWELFEDSLWSLDAGLGWPGWLAGLSWLWGRSGYVLRGSCSICYTPKSMCFTAKTTTTYQKHMGFW